MSAERRHSPDGAYWWTGEQWVPAWSADRRWWFDGRAWVPAAPRDSLLARADRVVAGLWVAFALVAMVEFGYVAHKGEGASKGWIAPLIGTAGVWVLAVIATGYVAGRAPLAWPRLCLAFGFLCLIAGVVYVESMLATTDANNDIEAGSGVVVLGVPAAALIALLLGLGALIRWAVAAIRRRMAETSPAS